MRAARVCGSCIILCAPLALCASLTLSLFIDHPLLVSLQDAALETYGEVSGKHSSTGQKVDIAMAKARLALQHGDFAVAKERIVEAKA